MKGAKVVTAGFQIPWSWIFGIALICAIAVYFVNKMVKELIGENSFDLSFKEFDLLKNLEEAGFVWIARDYNGKLHTYNVRPKRMQKMGVFFTWQPPKNPNIEVRSARIRKNYFCQISRFSRTPYQISDILYIDGKTR